MTAGHDRSRSLISIDDLGEGDLTWIVGRGVVVPEDLRLPPILAGRHIGIYFRRTSTRTRTAFTVAAQRLGASVVAFGPNDLQLNTGETSQDTGRVFARMLDGLVARTADDVAEFRTWADVGLYVVNAMSADEHPTQALADLSTITRRLGAVDGLDLLYVGEGNNTAAALALALARYPGTTLTLLTPPGFGLADDKLDAAKRHAALSGSTVVEHHHVEYPDEVDVVYTTRWETTGTVKPRPDWREVFEPFRVDGALLDRWPDAVFMHDLPANRGEEVTAEVLDGPRSIAFDQAEMKLWSAVAVLEWCFGGSLRLADC